MKLIMVTDFDFEDNVLIFTDHLTVDQVKSKLDQSSNCYNEIFEIQESEIPYYCFEPCWMMERKLQIV